jgi:hypothetical protein
MNEYEVTFKVLTTFLRLISAKERLAACLR